MISRTRGGSARQRTLTVMAAVGLSCLMLLSRTAHSDGDAAEIGTVLDGLPAPHAKAGFVYKGVSTITQAGRSIHLPLDMFAYPAREAGSAAWIARMDMRREPLDARETVWFTPKLTPIRGEIVSKQGQQQQTLSWRRAGTEISYEMTTPDGRTQKGSVITRKRVLVAGPGLVLFLRQLRPVTGTFNCELLVSEVLVQAGLAPVTLVVSKRTHDGAEAYVGEATLAGGAFRTVVVLDPDTGALRTLETHVTPRKQVSRFGQIQDKGISEVHNQTSGVLQRLGDFAGALAEVEAAQAADPDDSVYPNRIGSLRRELAKAAPTKAVRIEHTMHAAQASTKAADLIAKGLKSGRLQKEGSATFTAIRQGLYEVAGQEFLVVLASDKDATSFFGVQRSALELAAATAFVEAAMIATKGRAKAMEMAAGIAGGFAQQRIGKGDEKVMEQLAALAVTAYTELVRASSRDASLWYQMGFMHYIARQNERAITALERCLSLRPKSPFARLYLGGAYARVGKLTEANRQLRILESVGQKVNAQALRVLIALEKSK